jgi:ankyrin repeat protein
MSLEDPLVSEAIKTITDAVDKRRADVVHTVLTTAAESSPADEAVKPLQIILSHVDDKNGTCLHYATKNGCLDIVRTLLAAGADPSIRDKQNKTAYDLVTNQQMRNVYVNELLQAVAHQG